MFENNFKKIFINSNDMPANRSDCIDENHLGCTRWVKQA